MLGAASERVRILYRVKPRPTVIPLAQRREFFGVQKATENGYELNEHRKDFSKSKNIWLQGAPRYNKDAPGFD